jgi:hypothetical protein
LQGFSEAKAGLKCHASVGESFVADLWTALAPTHTGSHAFQTSRNPTKFSRARVRRTLTPNRSATALVRTRSFFWCLVWRLERERMAAFGSDCQISKLASRS